MSTTTEPTSTAAVTPVSPGQATEAAAAPAALPNELQFLADAAAQAAALLRAVGNEHRLLVLCLLIQHGEMSVGALRAFIPGLSQSALSQHLARMREEGLVVYRREAQTLYYRIGNPQVDRLVGLLKDMYCP